MSTVSSRTKELETLLEKSSEREKELLEQVARLEYLLSVTDSKKDAQIEHLCGENAMLREALPVINALLDITREAYFTLADCEESCDADGYSHFNITGDHARALSVALDVLDDLPEDLEPNVVMTGPAKASFILNKALSSTKESSASWRNGIEADALEEAADSWNDALNCGCGVPCDCVSGGSVVRSLRRMAAEKRSTDKLTPDTK